MTWRLINTIFTLLVIYQIKHFVADFLLQGKYMLGKFKGGTAWILPLTAHVAVHGAFTLVIASVFLAGDWASFCGQRLTCIFWVAMSMTIRGAGKAALLDMSVHFVMDRIKASPNLLGRFKYITAQDFESYNEYMNCGIREANNPELILYCKNKDAEFKKKFRSNTFFWWSLGLDQMVHALTHYSVIYYLLTCL